VVVVGKIRREEDKDEREDKDEKEDVEVEGVDTRAKRLNMVNRIGLYLFVY
jgi:hypothetical protein